MKKTTTEILELNVNDKIREKNGLKYLSWAFAWDYVLREIDENAIFEVQKFDGVPYFFDANTGYLVMTKVTINGVIREMYLPVMDGANSAMKNVPYKYITKKGEKTCEAATMFDINKTIQRCLVKNIAMFGLGLYIYLGEDLPELSDETKDQKEKEKIEALEVVTEKLKTATTREEVIAIYNEYLKVDKKEVTRLCAERSEEIKKA